MIKNQTIQVLGSGCITCKKFYDLVTQAVKELNIDIAVEYIPDVQKMLEIGLMQSPALLISNKPILVGFTNNIDKIKKTISENI